MAENIAGGIFADLAAHLKPDRGMEESIIMARCVGIAEWTRTLNYQSAWSRWVGEEKDSGMQCPSRYTSDQQGASRQLECEPRDMPSFNPPASFRRSSSCVFSQQCVSSSSAGRGLGKHSIKCPPPFFVKTYLPCKEK